MQAALAQSDLAAAAGEVPVGAVVVQGERIIGVGHNATVGHADPTAHAEIMALRAAAQHVGNYRLEDCELFVTLEPCTMCAGAITHARPRRLIFGAPEPKTGAVGSVLNVLAEPRLSHHTQVTSGVLQEECAQRLKDFFTTRRAETKEHRMPLREDALRTPESCFTPAMRTYPWQGRTLQTLPSLQGLRLHYVCEGPDDAPQTVLLVHGQPTWGYWFRHWVAPLVAAGVRVIVPDCIGYGKSDKPKKSNTVGQTQQVQILQELLQHLHCTHVCAVGQGWSAPIVAQLLHHCADVSHAVMLMEREDTPPPMQDIAALLGRSNPHLQADELAAYCAPFPDAGHRAALQRHATEMDLHHSSVLAHKSCVHCAWDGLREPHVDDLPLLWDVLHSL
jgi:tRNA(adenine34) deaminase